jgi:hypothetical protein
LVNKKQEELKNLIINIALDLKSIEDKEEADKIKI